MRRHLVSAVVAATFANLVNISKTKGSEYSMGNDDSLINFKQAGERVGSSPLSVLFIAMDKHFNSVSNYVKKVGTTGHPPENLSESIFGRLDDLILYAILMKCLIHDLGFESVVTETSETVNVKSLETSGELNHDSIRSLTSIIVGWASGAFPSRNTETIRRKLMFHEIPELVVELGKTGNAINISDEAADVLILLFDLFDLLGVDIGKAVSDKMNQNVDREWEIDGNGVSYHKK